MTLRKKWSRRRSGKLAAALLACVAALSLPAAELPGAASAFGPVGAFAAQYAETVRVGIYYGKDNVSTVSLRSDTGLTLSAEAGVSSVLVWDQPDANAVIVRKDAWFVRTADGLTQEYAPNAGAPAAGDVTGPIHLAIGGKLADYQTAATLAASYRAAGVRAWPAYEGGWQVWAGTYADVNAANAGKQATADLVGTSAVTVLNATGSRLVLLNPNMEPVCFYGGTDGYLTATAKNGADLLTVNGKRYRGTMEFRRYADSDLTLINTLGVEPYLYGVVPSEIGALSPGEAIKAQAVAARTYTLKNIGRYAKWGFDLADTIESQVYSGYEGEKVQTNLAVDATRGLKAMYNGQLASLFYFSSSGGMTEDNVNVWGTPLPYLKSVEDPYEAKNSYNYYWQKVLTADDVARYLAAAGINLGTIQSVSIVEMSAAKRVTRLRVTGTAGSTTFAREACRTIFELPSQMYTLGGTESLSVLGADGSVSAMNPGGLAVVSADGVTRIPSGIAAVAVGGDGTLSYTGTASTGLFVLTGLGWGHGVGMSQEGAKGYASKGYTYDQILQHYFPGITLE